MSFDLHLERLATWLGARSALSWLVVGPQGDAATVRQASKAGFATIALASAAEASLNADLTVVMDVETLMRRGSSIGAASAVVAVPSDLHHGGWSTGRPLAEWVATIPILEELAAQGRLLVFDLWTARDPEVAVRGVEGDFLGQEVPLRLLVQGGVKMARHLGFARRRDRVGGMEAAHSLLAGATGGIPQLRRDSGISYGPYGYPVPARIFVGSDDEQLIGVQVLHYSIEKYSSMDVTVETLDWRRMPVPRDPKNRSRTGFSFCRFDIPRLCGYEGRGVYVDADMQLFTDVADLWTLPLDEADLLYSLTAPGQGRTPQTSVMLLNCETLRWDVNDIIRGLDEETYSYKELMSDLCVVRPGRAQPLVPYWWNSLEAYEPGRTSLIHYTDMHTQPWVSPSNRNGELWYRCCAEAIDSGFVDIADVERAVEAGHVSSRIFQWLGRTPPRNYDAHEATWVAPYNRFLNPRAPEGAVTLTTDNRLMGWAWNPATPNDPIDVDVYDGETVLFSFKGDQPGAFLERYGKGDGRHVFDIALPGEVLTSNAHRLSVRTRERRVELSGSPVEVYR